MSLRIIMHKKNPPDSTMSKGESLPVNFFSHIGADINCRYKFVFYPYFVNLNKFKLILVYYLVRTKFQLE